MKITAQHQKRHNYIKDLDTFANILDHMTAPSSISTTEHLKNKQNKKTIKVRAEVRSLLR